MAPGVMAPGQCSHGSQDRGSEANNVQLDPQLAADDARQTAITAIVKAAFKWMRRQQLLPQDQRALPPGPCNKKQVHSRLRAVLQTPLLRWLSMRKTLGYGGQGVVKCAANPQEDETMEESEIARKFMVVTAKEVSRGGLGPLTHELGLAALMTCQYLPQEDVEAAAVACPRQINVLTTTDCKKELQQHLMEEEWCCISDETWSRLDGQPGLLFVLDYQLMVESLDAYILKVLHKLEHIKDCPLRKELLGTGIGSHVMNMKQALELLIKPTKAMHTFQSRWQLLHGDAKPANFLVTYDTTVNAKYDGECPEVQVADLAAATPQRQHPDSQVLYSKGAMIGSEDFMGEKRLAKWQEGITSLTSEDEIQSMVANHIAVLLGCNSRQVQELMRCVRLWLRLLPDQAEAQQLLAHNKELQQQEEETRSNGDRWWEWLQGMRAYGPAGDAFISTMGVLATARLSCHRGGRAKHNQMHVFTMHNLAVMLEGVYTAFIQQVSDRNSQYVVIRCGGPWPLQPRERNVLSLLQEAVQTPSDLKGLSRYHPDALDWLYHRMPDEAWPLWLRGKLVTRLQRLNRLWFARWHAAAPPVDPTAAATTQDEQCDSDLDEDSPASPMSLVAACDLSGDDQSAASVSDGSGATRSRGNRHACDMASTSLARSASCKAAASAVILLEPQAASGAALLSSAVDLAGLSPCNNPSQVPVTTMAADQWCSSVQVAGPPAEHMDCGMGTTGQPTQAELPKTLLQAAVCHTPNTTQAHLTADSVTDANLPVGTNQASITAAVAEAPLKQLVPVAPDALPAAAQQLRVDTDVSCTSDSGASSPTSVVGSPIPSVSDGSASGGNSPGHSLQGSVVEDTSKGEPASPAAVRTTTPMVEAEMVLCESPSQLRLAVNDVATIELVDKQETERNGSWPVDALPVVQYISSGHGVECMCKEEAEFFLPDSLLDDVRDAAVIGVCRNHTTIDNSLSLLAEHLRPSTASFLNAAQLAAVAHTWDMRAPPAVQQMFTSSSKVVGSQQKSMTALLPCYQQQTLAGTGDVSQLPLSSYPVQQHQEPTAQDGLQLEQELAADTYNLAIVPYSANVLQQQLWPTAQHDMELEDRAAAAQKLAIVPYSACSQHMLQQQQEPEAQQIPGVLRNQLKQAHIMELETVSAEELEPAPTQQQFAAQAPVLSSQAGQVQLTTKPAAMHLQCAAQASAMGVSNNQQGLQEPASPTQAMSQQQECIAADMNSAALLPMVAAFPHGLFSDNEDMAMAGCSTSVSERAETASMSYAVLCPSGGTSASKALSTKPHGLRAADAGQQGAAGASSRHWEGSPAAQLEGEVDHTAGLLTTGSSSHAQQGANCWLTEALAGFEQAQRNRPAVRMPRRTWSSVQLRELNHCGVIRRAASVDDYDVLAFSPPLESPGTQLPQLPPLPTGTLSQQPQLHDLANDHEQALRAHAAGSATLNPVTLRASDDIAERAKAPATKSGSLISRLYKAVSVKERSSSGGASDADLREIAHPKAPPPQRKGKGLLHKARKEAKRVSVGAQDALTQLGKFCRKAGAEIKWMLVQGA